MSALPIEEPYTIDYIESLPPGERAELIDGKLYSMAAPSVIHQRLIMNLSAALHSFIRSNGGKCEVFPAPFAVYLDGLEDRYNYLEPDISVICDPSRLENGKGCSGPPDMVIEIVSPSTAYLDRVLKLEKYRRSGVTEYWIVDPVSEKIDKYDFKAGQVISYSFSDPASVSIFGGQLEITLAALL